MIILTNIISGRRWQPEIYFIDDDDAWRVMNIFVHAPGTIGQIVKANWFKSNETGTNPMTACESGESYSIYDAVGNVVGVLEDGSAFYRWEMDAFGNDLPGGNAFLPMDQPGPKEHLTGKMFDTVTGLYYFHARWYDPQVGRFLGRDPKSVKIGTIHKSCSGSIDFFPPMAVAESAILNDYSFCMNNPMKFVDSTGEWAFIAEILVGIGIHFELGCMPGTCCWVKLQAGLGIGVGWSVDPSATHPCPPKECGDCLSLSAKCEKALGYLIGQIGYETGIVTQLLCTSSSVLTPPEQRYKGPTSSLAKAVCVSQLTVLLVLL